MSKNKTNYLDPIAIAIAGIASAQSIPLWHKLVNEKALVVFFTALTSVAVYNLIILFFKTIPKRFAWSRKIVDPRAKYEGFYIEIKNINKTRCYAIVCLSYNYPTDEYQLSGTSIESDGSIGVNWKSNFVRIDTIAKKIIYAQTGHLTHTSDGRIFDGVTYMNFNYFPNGKPISGIGHYVDTIPAKSDFAFEKITEKNCQSLIGKKVIESRNDYKEYVKNFHQAFPDKVFSWE